nr:ATP-dependent DNA helicase [Vallicoccus soli]
MSTGTGRGTRAHRRGRGPDRSQGSLFALDEVGTALPAPRFSAVELSRRLGQAHPPTPEQARCIEHLDGDGRLAPHLVVAGAGSGKTETMAARVVWLVANRLVRPERVLGLTFTSKAAGELAERVRRRLRDLARSGVLPPDDEGEDWLLGEPAVSTYHAYAARLFSEHALRIGREPSSRLLGEAVAWQFAGRVVDAHDGAMDAVDWAPATVVAAVRGLAGDLAEHLVEPAEVSAFARDLEERVLALPPGEGFRGKGAVYADTQGLLDLLRRRTQLLPLVEAFAARKRAADALDHGDQVALAARIAREHPEVGRQERARYDVVLLDEYQDTGTAQRVLLTSLFGEGHPVTAVGDPCQSIYGWRGASAGALRRFGTDFPHRSGAPSEQLDLTTSFRNGGRILAVANRLSAPLRAQGVPVRDLRPGPRGEASGEVVHACFADAQEEARWVAATVRDLVAPAEGPARYAPAQVAVLARARSQFDRLEQALRAQGLPVEVSGLGGLLSTPEVGDVVATLAALSDPGAGPAVLRLLTGARWRLGPRDLDALARRARRLARPLPPAVAPGAGATGAAAPAAAPGDADVERLSLVEALDDPGPAGDYSAAGWERLSGLRRELRSLRARADQSLPDLVADVVRTTGLDVEVAARPAGDPAGARAHLDRFLDVAAEFAETEEDPSVSAFLAYLEAAAEHERGLDLGRVGPAGDAVQLLTMHGAKGLEWPVVVVPGMTRKVFPSTPRESPDWCRNAKLLPFPLRGDRDDLPALALQRAEDQRDVRDALAAHKDACAERHLLEERRLAYVAATRAEDLLVCTGYGWDHTSTWRGPSDFLLEVRAACEELGVGTDAGWAEPPEDPRANPLDAGPREASWPLDPLDPGARARLDAAAARVRAAMAAGGAGAPGGSAALVGAAGAVTGAGAEQVAEWTQEVDDLLAERARLQAHRGVVDVDLPAHLSVSQLVALRRDPDALARWLRRPVPLAPAPLARRGTAFHAWVEQRFGGARLLDVDELPGAADEGAAPDADLEELKERFLRGPWAERRPVPGGVEVPFEMLVGGVLVRGRMDAVFGGEDEDGPRWDVVDWKTGSPPSGEEARAAAVQLAAYRLAWHRLSGAPLHRVTAAFHYVRSGRTVRPADLLDADGLEALLRGVPTARD